MDRYREWIMLHDPEMGQQMRPVYDYEHRRRIPINDIAYREPIYPHDHELEERESWHMWDESERQRMIERNRAYRAMMSTQDREETHHPSYDVGEAARIYKGEVTGGEAWGTEEGWVSAEGEQWNADWNESECVDMEEAGDPNAEWVVGDLSAEWIEGDHNAEWVEGDPNAEWTEDPEAFDEEDVDELEDEGNEATKEKQKLRIFKTKRATTIPRCYLGPHFDSQYNEFVVRVSPITYLDALTPGFSIITSSASSIRLALGGRREGDGCLVNSCLELMAKSKNVRGVVRGVLMQNFRAEVLSVTVEQRKAKEGADEGELFFYPTILRTASFKVKNKPIRQHANRKSTATESGTEKAGALSLHNLPRNVDWAFIRVLFPFSLSGQMVEEEPRSALLNFNSSKMAVLHTACVTGLQIDGQPIHMKTDVPQTEAIQTLMDIEEEEEEASPTSDEPKKKKKLSPSDIRRNLRKRREYEDRMAGRGPLPPAPPFPGIPSLLHMSFSGPGNMPKQQAPARTGAAPATGTVSGSAAQAAPGSKNAYVWSRTSKPSSGARDASATAGNDSDEDGLGAPIPQMLEGPYPPEWYFYAPGAPGDPGTSTKFRSHGYFRRRAARVAVHLMHIWGGNLHRVGKVLAHSLLPENMRPPPAMPPPKLLCFAPLTDTQLQRLAKKVKEKVSLEEMRKAEDYWQRKRREKMQVFKAQNTATDPSVVAPDPPPTASTRYRPHGYFRRRAARVAVHLMHIWGGNLELVGKFLAHSVEPEDKVSPNAVPPPELLSITPLTTYQLKELRKRVRENNVSLDEMRKAEAHWQRKKKEKSERAQSDGAPTEAGPSVDSQRSEGKSTPCGEGNQQSSGTNTSPAQHQQWSAPPPHQASQQTPYHHKSQHPNSQGQSVQSSSQSSTPMLPPPPPPSLIMQPPPLPPSQPPLAQKRPFNPAPARPFQGGNPPPRPFPPRTSHSPQSQFSHPPPQRAPPPQHQFSHPPPVPRAGWTSGYAPPQPQPIQGSGFTPAAQPEPSGPAATWWQGGQSGQQLWGTEPAVASAGGGDRGSSQHTQQQYDYGSYWQTSGVLHEVTGRQEQRQGQWSDVGQQQYY
ncbi:uncharacterized protein LOC143298333 [Babylonia areolata]|uniref:uncharacterized protein LOC143298333 n=1 Tax=Babylonia areolata TaxID=304850 RepID=UPI003FCEF100